MSNDTGRTAAPRILALTGGVGGAKLVLGLARVLPAGHLTALVNTGDDFRHLGLHISPDIDTTLYTLAGLANPELGWGRAGETWNFMASLGQLGGEDWFNLGDKDLALHVERTRRLADGESLSDITAAIAERFSIETAVLPMSDDPVATIVETTDGPLPFQHYFVRERCAPAVTGFRFSGLADARGNRRVISALENGSFDCIVIAPSNPFVSIDPILGLKDLRGALQAAAVPVVAVSPIVAGLAIKGPAAKMMAELGLPSSADAVARHYQERYPGLLTGLVIDDSDDALAPLVASAGLEPLVAPTVMRSLADREALARTCLEFSDTLRRPGVRRAGVGR